MSTVSTISPKGRRDSHQAAAPYGAAAVFCLCEVRVSVGDCVLPGEYLRGYIVADMDMFCLTGCADVVASFRCGVVPDKRGRYAELLLEGAGEVAQALESHLGTHLGGALSLLYASPSLGQTAAYDPPSG